VVSVLRRRTAWVSHWPAVLLIGPSHDGKALRGCSPFMLLLQASKLFDCDEHGTSLLPDFFLSGLSGLSGCLRTALTAARQSTVWPNRPSRTRTVRLSTISHLVHGSASSTREDHLIYARKIRETGIPSHLGNSPSAATGLSQLLDLGTRGPTTSNWV
jgi:hypothetical protein